MRQHSLQQVHMLTDAPTVYNKYMYLMMRQQSTTSTYTYWCANSLQQVHILTDALAVYNKYIYLLMRQQSTTSTYTHWCVNSLQQVHIEQHEPLKHGVNAYDPKEEACSAPLTVPIVYSLLETW